MLCVSPIPLHAHDPYEITTTLSLYSNRTELQILMEFRTGMLLVSREALIGPDEAQTLFDSESHGLREAAKNLFELSASGKELVAERVDATLGVENHIQFQVVYPPSLAQQLQLKPRALSALTNQGPYGASVSVLDMVNKKVVGQAVLFGTSPAAEFGPSPNSIEVAPAQVVRLSKSQIEPTSQPEPGAPVGLTAAGPKATNRTAAWWLIGVMGAGLLSFVFTRFSRKEPVA